MYFQTLYISKLQIHKKKVEASIEAGNGASKIPCHQLQYSHNLVQSIINIVLSKALFAVTLDTQSVISYFFSLHFLFFGGFHFMVSFVCGIWWEFVWVGILFDSKYVSLNKFSTRYEYLQVNLRNPKPKNWGEKYWHR